MHAKIFFKTASSYQNKSHCLTTTNSPSESSSTLGGHFFSHLSSATIITILENSKVLQDDRKMLQLLAIYSSLQVRGEI